MPILKFSVDADLQKVVDMRKEIDLLEAQLKTFSPTTATQSLEALTKQLEDARAQFSALTQSARDAGAKLVNEVRTSSAKVKSVKVPQVKVDIDTAAFHDKMEALLGDLQKSVGDIRAFGEQISHTMSSFASLAGWAVPTTGIFAFLDRMKNVRADFQDMESSMKVFLGSAEEGAKFTSKLQDYAWYNMFDFKQLVGCSKQMIAYGHSVDSIIPSLDKLSNVATGTNASLNEMVALYNKAKSIGTVDNEAIQSWAMRGVMIKDVLQDMGEKIRNNRVTFEQLDKVLTKVTDKGGMFHGVMDAQMNNISASIGQLQDNTDLMFNALGKQMEEPLRKVIDIAAAVVENLQTWGDVVFATISGPLSVLFSTVGDVMDAFTEWTDGLDPDTKEAAVKSLIVAWGAYKLTAISAEKAVQLEMEETIKKAERLKKEKTGTEPEQEGIIDNDLLNRVKRGKMTTEEAQKVQDARNYIASANTPSPDTVPDTPYEADLWRSKRENLERELDAGRRQLDRMYPQQMLYSVDIQRNLNAGTIDEKQATQLHKERNDLVERVLNKTGDEELYLGLRQARDKGTEIEASRRQLSSRTKAVTDIDSRLEQFQELHLLQEDEATNGNKDNKRSKRISELQTSLEGYDEQELLSKRSELMTKLETDLTAYQASVAELDQLQQQNLQRARILASDAPENTSLRQIADNEAALSKEMQENTPSLPSNETTGETSEEATDAIQEQLEAAQELTEGLEAAEEAENELSEATDNASNASRAHSAGQKADSAAVGANSAANKANAVAQGQAANASLRSTIATKAHAAASKVAATGSLLLRNAVNSVKASFDALKASIISNPIGMAITAISMAWTFFASKSDEADSQTEEFGETAIATANKVRSLCAILEATTKGSNAHSEAQTELNGLFEKYGVELNKQLGDTEAMIDAKQRLIEKIMEEGKQEQITANIKRMVKEQETNRTDFVKTLEDKAADNLDDEVAPYKGAIVSAIASDVEANADQIQNLVEKYEKAKRNSEIYEKTKIDFYNSDLSAKYRKEYTAAETALQNAVMETADKTVNSLISQNPTLKKEMFNLRDLFKDLVPEIEDFATKTIGNREGLKSYSEAVAPTDNNKEEKIDFMRNYGDAQKFQADMVKLFSEAPKDALEAAKKAQAEAAKRPQNSNEPIYTAQSEEDVNKLRSAYKSAQENVVMYRQKVEELCSVLKRISELQEQADKKPLTKPQQEELKELLGQALSLENELGALSDTTINPKANTIDVDKLKEAIDEAKKSGKEVDGSTIKVLTDSTMVDGLQRKLSDLQSLAKKLKNIELAIGVKISAAFAKMLKTIDKILGTETFKAFYAPEEQAVENAQENETEMEENQQKLLSEFKTKLKNAKTDSDYNDLNTAIDKAMAEAPQNSKIRRDLEALKRQAKYKDRRNAPQPGQYDSQEREYARYKQKKQNQRTEERQKRDNDNRIKQAGIDDMTDGRNKDIAQIEFDAEKQRQAIADKIQQETDRLEQEALKTWLNKGFNRKEWQFYQNKAELEKKQQEWLRQAKTNTQSEKQLNEIQAAEQRKLTKLREDDANAFRDFVKEVGTFAKRLQTIKDSYDFKIRKAQEGGDAAEAARLTHSRDTDVKKAINDEFAQKHDYSPLLSNLDSHTDDWLMQMLNKIETEVKNVEPNSDITNDNFQQLTSYVTALRQEIGKRENEAERDALTWSNLFKFASGFANPEADEQQNAVTQAEADAHTANLNLVYANKLLEQASLTYANKLDELNKLTVGTGLQTVDENGEVIATISEIENYFTDGKLRQEVIAALQAVNDAKGKQEKAANEATDATNKATQADDALQNAKDNKEHKNDTWKDKLTKAGKLVEKANEYGQGMYKVVASMGLDDTDAGKAIESFSNSVSSAAGAYTSLISGDFVGAISQAIDALGGFGDMLGDIGIVGGESDRNYEKDMAKLTASNEALRTAIQELSEAMQEQSLVEATKTYEQQKENSELAEANTKQALRRSGASRKDGYFDTSWDEEESANEKINNGMSAEMWQHVSAAAGRGIRSAQDFWTLTSEEMYQVSVQAPEAFAEIVSLGDEGYKKVGQYMNEYIQYSKQQDELFKQLQQKLTDTTWQNVADGFKSTLLDMTSSSETFADNFQKIMEQAVVNSLMANTYNEQIEQWYGTFSKMMTDGELDTTELRELRNRHEAISNDALRQRNAIKEAMGFSADQQGQASSKNFASMSQDTGNELNGRFAAMQVAMETTRSEVATIVGNSATSALSLANIDANILGLLNSYNAFRPHYESMNNQLSKMYLELLDIKSNTKAIIEPIKSIQSDIAEVKNHTKRL